MNKVISDSFINSHLLKLMENSEKDGLWISWYENGQKKIKGINKDGRR
jgi:antitoxin component YwqK of YwqJK toxin-antitoxin module